MKKIITAALACAMIISSLCGCAHEIKPTEQPVQLPEKYILSDLGLVTIEKDQKYTGLCASYALINACESSLLVNGYENVDDLDLSEAHLYYYCHSFNDDKAYGTDGYFQSINREESKGNFLLDGSETFTLVNLLANGCGPVDETVVEFDPEHREQSTANLNAAHKSGAMEKYMGEYLLTGANYHNNETYEPIYENSSIREMKRSIFADGAASVSTTTAKYSYNFSDAGIAYYEGIYSAEDIVEHAVHAVSVIGWDDNFSRENFGRNKPDNDGAWYIKDSSRFKNGEYYYWSSYEQPLPGFTTVELTPRDEYGDVLFYDNLRMDRNIRADGEETVAANVFTVDKDCALKAAGVPTAAKNQPVIIEVYHNPDEYDPQSGRRVARLETTIDMPGYHVVDLEESVKLNAGDSFSILIRYRTDSSGVSDWLGRVPVEGDVTETEKKIFDVLGIDCVLASQPGQSYVVYDNKWYDTSYSATAELFGLDVTLNNFGIKALMDKE